MPFPINLIFNVKAFYFFFIIVMIASMAAVGFASTGSGTSNIQRSDPIDLTPVPEVTPAVKNFPGPAPVVDGTKVHLITLETNAGDIVIETSPDAPQAVNSFAFLAAKNFYDGTAFFFLDHNYWAQAGDAACSLDSDTTCTGTADAGYKLPIENPEGKHVQWAVVAPSIQGTDTVSGGQFRILFQADDRLNGRETVVGNVVEGQEILAEALDMKLCSALTQVTPDCQADLANALIIENVTIEEA